LPNHGASFELANDRACDVAVVPGTSEARLISLTQPIISGPSAVTSFVAQATSTLTSTWKSLSASRSGRVLHSPLAQGSLTSSIIRTLPSQTPMRTADSSDKSPRL
jgi:hypothetical protein